MEMNRMFVQVVNITEGKVFSLPTLYTDRTEACVCGQNYIRDRQAENISEMLFFRVLNADPDGSISPSYTLWDDEDEDEDDCECPDGQEVCFGCPNFSECWEEDEEDEEEMPTCGNCDGDCQFCPTNYAVDEDEDEDEVEEPSSDSLAELLSVFNAIRPNY